MKEKENGYYSHFLMNALLNWVRSDTMTPEQKSNAVYVALVGALTYPANWGDANLGISTLQELLVSSDVPETRVRAVEALATFGTGGFLQLNNEAEFIISQYFYETDSPADARVNYELKLILRAHRPFVLRYGPGLVGRARCGIDLLRWGVGLMPVREWFPGGYRHPRQYQP